MKILEKISPFAFSFQFLLHSRDYDNFESFPLCQVCSLRTRFDVYLLLLLLRLSPFVAHAAFSVKAKAPIEMPL